MAQNISVEEFISHIQVSRETIKSLIQYEELIVECNKSLNLIGKSTEKTIWKRHFLDSAQVIDFIEENSKIVDLGTGAGFPGVVLSILGKDRNKSLKVELIEKSPKKTLFLKRIIKDLKLDISVLNTDVLIYPKKISCDVITARAFMPLKKILGFFHEKTENWKKIFIFLGKNGGKELHEASKNWDIQYKQRRSITNSDSKILEVYNLKRKKIEQNDSSNFSN